MDNIDEFYNDFRRTIVKRRITPCHAMFASFLASLSAAGVLNQAIANFMAKHAARVLHAYLKALGKLEARGSTVKEKFENLVKSLNEALDIGDKVVFKEEGDMLLVGLGGNTCRYCPRGVGKAEIPGTACPFPRLIEAIAQLEGLKVEHKPFDTGKAPQALKREEGLCWIQYRLP